MKLLNYSLAIIFLLLNTETFSQVGIGNTNPNAQLDISASNSTSPSNTDGILIPRVANLTATTSMTINQDGMLVFYTGTGFSGKGFYYWNQSSTSWIPVTNSNDSDWFESSSSTSPDNINDNIFTNGFVGIRRSNPTLELDVLGQGRFVSSGFNDADVIIATKNNDSNGAAIYAETTSTYNLRTYSAIETANALTDYTVEVNKYTNGSLLNTGVLITGNDVRRVNERGFVVDFQQTGTGSYISENIGFLYDISYNGGSSGTLYGFKAEIDGSGSAPKYGARIDIPNTSGGTHYGLYSNVQKTNSYAGYFIGRTSFGNTTVNRYTLPASDGTAGQVLTTDGSGNTSWTSFSGGKALTKLRPSTTSQASGYTKIDFTIEDFDVTNNFNASSDRFTATSQGYYRINANIRINTTSSNASSTFGFAIYKNGTLLLEKQKRGNGIAGSPFYIGIDTTITLNSGDYIEFYTYKPGAFPVTYFNFATLTNNWVEIQQVD